MHADGARSYHRRGVEEHGQEGEALGGVSGGQARGRPAEQHAQHEVLHGTGREVGGRRVSARMCC